MADQVVQLIPITEFDEDMLVAIDRNNKELARLIGGLQIYMNKEGKPRLGITDDFTKNCITHGLKANIPSLT